MDMTSLNISLPKPMKEFIETRVVEDQYSTPSEYLRALIREDQKRREDQKLEALLLESLQSGESIEVTPEYWLKKRQSLMQRLGHSEA
ncbi:MAG: type II toxin-antitoxin system ParD family antitoxin [Phormidesmis sp. CAN_BIN44]|nr:type II toxin-antitoxin system ParD family antitoxin [Phormidesmis sp. CAN_BIN44]